MCCELVLVAVLATGGDMKLCSAWSSSSGMDYCLPGTVLGLKIWMGCELGLVVVLATDGYVKLCSALGSCSSCEFATG